MNPKKIFVVMMALVAATFVISSAPAFAQVDTAWVRRYNGPGDAGDEAAAIAVDGSGNVYVTGKSYGSGTHHDYTTITYDTDGNIISGWPTRYDGPAGSTDEAHAIAVDGSGNVYVTGWSYHGVTHDDYATIKYYPSGDTTWVRRYNMANIRDHAEAIAVDASGYVYVTGSSWTSGAYVDYATIKYYPNGDTVWVRRYDKPGNSAENAESIAVDDSGNVYVTGWSSGSRTGSDYATIKYYPNGDTAWVRRYNGPGNSVDLAVAIAVDGSNNVYVTGPSWGIGTGFDYATIKYYPNGDTAWVRRYNGPANFTDDAFDIAVDGSGNVYVTGGSDQTSQYPRPTDYATIKYYPDGDTAWVRRYNGPGDSTDQAVSIAVDGSGNVYVTGKSWGGETDFDYATIKYDPNGNQLWVERYNGPGNDYDLASAIAVDDYSNIYVTGYTSGSGTLPDYATIKYITYPITIVSPNGGETWRGGWQYYIRWLSQGFTGDVRIEYSLTSGASFDSVIVWSYPNTGEYLWEVPCISSNYCRVRVCDAIDCDPADTSDSDFIITECVPALTNYGTIVLFILLMASAVWMIKRKRLATERNN